MMASLAPFADNIRVPGPGDSVHKDECLVSYVTPESPDGLYICLSKFVGLSRAHVEQYSANTGSLLFLHARTIKTRKKKEEATSVTLATVSSSPSTTEEKEDGGAGSGGRVGGAGTSPPPSKRPTKLGIGVEGGFALEADEWDISEEYNLVILPGFEVVPLDTPGVPERIQLAATGVIAAKAAAAAAEISAWEEERKVSKHAGALLQLDNGVRVPPSGWKCTRCDKTENLWVNLTDGTILCGRRNFDGSGGNNHGVEYYRETRYPLAVKLGTITPEGADVFSYDEDDMVLDPNLEQHLRHFGINMKAMTKTVATMAELEIEANANLKLEFDAIQEAGSRLEPLYGPGLTGMRNLGNTCYMASVMQVLFSLDEFVRDYAGDAALARFAAVSAKSLDDFGTQMSKLAHGLISGQYSAAAPVDGGDGGGGASSDGASGASASGDTTEQDGICPRTFKSLVGRGHPEFSTPAQQDAMEFFQHLMSLIERAARREGLGGVRGTDLSRLFAFELEERIVCAASGKVRYTLRPERHLALQALPELITNADAVADFEARFEAHKVAREAARAAGEPAPAEAAPDPVRANIPFESALASAMAEEVIPDWHSPVTKANTGCTRGIKFSAFPRYLVLTVNKFYQAADWSPKKRDVNMWLPDVLDLTPYAATGGAGGLQPGEEELPDDAPPPAC